MFFYDDKTTEASQVEEDHEAEDWAYLKHVRALIDSGFPHGVYIRRAANVQHKTPNISPRWDLSRCRRARAKIQMLEF